MLQKYEAWFDDVGHTREDNYAPPRIHIGTAHESPVVLTRQDWRHAKGRPWAADSNGYWELHAAKAGDYRVRLRFPEAKVAGQATLDMGVKTRTQAIEAGDTECTFEAVPAPKGNLRLVTTLAFGSESKGPWQVDVFAP